MRAATPAALTLILCGIVILAALPCAHGAPWNGTFAAPAHVAAWQAQLGGATHKPRRNLLQSELLTVEACISGSLSDVAATCSGRQADGDVRDRLVKLMLLCLSNDTTTPEAARNQPMRMLLTASVAGSLVKNMTEMYTELTDVPIRVDMPSLPTASTARLQSVANAANYSATHEAWMIPTSASGDGIASGAFKTITNLVTLDNRLAWEGLLPILRTSGLLYKSQVFGMPLSTHTYHLAYRKDAFEQYNLTVPRTWKELLDFAVTKNGTNGMHAFCGVWSPCFNLGSLLLRAMLASYHQTHGPKQGWLFDADSMELLLDSPAMAESIDLLKGLYAASPPDESLALGCPAYGYRFTGPTGGQCLMSIVHPNTIKYASHQSRINVSANLYGNLGIAPWPGSETVLDRATNTLVPCDSERCPYASRASKPDGSTMLINRSPLFEAQMLALNAHSATDVSFFTMSVLSYLSAPETSNALVLNADSDIFPSRTSQLDWRLWVAAGFNEHDARAYCGDSIASLNHPNINLQLRIPGASEFLALVDQTATSASAGASTSKVVETAKTAGIAALNRAYQGDGTALKLQYWASLNRVSSSLPPSQASPASTSPPVPAPPTGDAAGDEGVKQTKHTTMFIVCLVIPAYMLGLMAALAARHCWVSQLRHRNGSLRHPGMGPATTLCVTDIEDSTALWEDCDELVMDTSVKLHNGCVRNLAVKHAGYETVWEGDSFVIAFRHPTQAVAFCMAVQKELLLLPWPAALLQTSQANEVWCCAPKKSQNSKSFRFGARSPAAATIPALYPTPTSQPGTSVFASNNSSGGHFKDNEDGEDDASSNRLSKLVAKPQLFLTLSSVAGVVLQPSTSTASSIETVEQKRNVMFTLPGSLGGGEASTCPDKPQGSQHHTVRPPKDMGAQWRGQWVACAPGTPQAVLAFRGLRVRLGMHAGIETASCVRYNAVMRRYHYTGPVRVISNAIASAGHGGYTLLSSSTASLLCPDSTGVLEGLPSDCSVFNLGSHRLASVEDNIELLLVLPNALQCRLGLQQTALRSLGTKVPGVLAAPIPMRCAADNSALVYIQFSGLDVLLAWNAKEATHALKCATECLRLEVGEWCGVISEDGLAAAMQGRKTKTAGLMSAASFPDQVEPGRMVIAFDAGLAAVAFALSSRHQLLMLDWSEQLLSHELCERVGQGAPGGDFTWGQAGAQEHGEGMVGSCSNSRLLALPYQDGALDTEVSFGDMHHVLHIGPDPPPQQPGLGLAGDGNPVLGAGLGPQQPGTSAACGHTVPAIERSTLSTASTTGSSHRFTRQATTQSLTARLTMPQSSSNTMNRSFVSRDAGARRAMSPREARTYTTLDAPMLRGLRIRTVIVPGKGAEFVVATRSSGRCVYGGKPAKVAAKLLTKVHAGQVVVESKLLQAALQQQEADMRLMSAETAGVQPNASS